MGEKGELNGDPEVGIDTKKTQWPKLKIGAGFKGKDKKGGTALEAEQSFKMRKGEEVAGKGTSQGKTAVSGKRIVNQRVAGRGGTGPLITSEAYSSIRHSEGWGEQNWGILKTNAGGLWGWRKTLKGDEVTYRDRTFLQ